MSISRLISLIAGKNSLLSFRHSSLRSFYIGPHVCIPARPEHKHWDCNLCYNLWLYLHLSFFSQFTEFWRSKRLPSKMNTHGFTSELCAEIKIQVRQTHYSQNTVKVCRFALNSFLNQKHSGKGSCGKTSEKEVSCFIWLESFIRKTLWAL